jgi:hypothetical protein
LQHLIDELTDRDPETAKAAQGLAEASAEAYFVDRYPGFDLDDPDWPRLERMLAEVSGLVDRVRRRIGGSPPRT